MKEPKSRPRKRKDPDDGCLSKCVIDIFSKKFHLYSDKGATRVIESNTIDEFIDQLSIVRQICDYGSEFLPEDCIEYKEI
jgi:hypothetical protein